jgi:integrase
MATIGCDVGGRRRVLFVASDGKRKTVRLGKVSQRTAESIKHRVEQLLETLAFKRPMDADLSAWVTDLGPQLADRLARVGLIPKAGAKAATLGPFLGSYVKGRADVKQSTATVYGHTRRCLIEYFGAEKSLHEISQGDADQWRLWLGSHEKLADNTIRRRCGIAKQFFKAAVRHRLIAENPFLELVAAVRRNEKRYYYISREEAQKVLETCPDAQWRLLFALSRFGGLRCPSEHLGLRWGDVDWEGERVTVHSPKTEHHPGGDCRQIPLFAELRPYLEEAFEEAEPGTEYVITRYRDSNTNLRTQLQKIIRRAGLKPWPKLWQNLRSTRETELAETYPIHVVCQWIGNSQAVAAKHYLQVTDEHFRAAVEGPKGAAQNPAQQAQESGRKPSQQKQENPGFSGVCDGVQLHAHGLVGGTGLEPATSTV